MVAPVFHRGKGHSKGFGRGKGGGDGGRGGRGSGRGVRGFNKQSWSGHDTHRHSSGGYVKSRDYEKPVRDSGKGSGKGRRKGPSRVVASHLSRTTFRPKKPTTPAVQRVDEEGIARHCEVKAHEGAITAIAMTAQGVYTASSDKKLKRWKPQRGDNGQIGLTCELVVELPDSCYCMLHHSGGWIFCGLWSGPIRAFAQDGSNSTLSGHTKKVTAMIIHENVLISGSHDGEVRLWQMNADTKVFSCTHVVKDDTPGTINKLRVQGSDLWIGGSKGVALCDLVNLKITKLLPPIKYVADFLEFQGHIIVAYSDGGLRVFDQQGTEKSDMKPISNCTLLCVAGLETGPRIVCGHARGQVSTIALPEFQFKTQFQAFDGQTRVDSVMCAGHDGIFLLGSASGMLQLWQKAA